MKSLKNIIFLVGAAVFSMTVGCAKSSPVKGENSLGDAAAPPTTSAAELASLADAGGVIAAAMSEEAESGVATPVYICLLNPQDDASDEIKLNLIVKTESGSRVAVRIRADRGENGPENPEPIDFREVALGDTVLPDTDQQALVYQSPDFFQLISMESPEEADFLHPGFDRVGESDTPTICVDLEAAQAESQ